MPRPNALSWLSPVEPTDATALGVADSDVLHALVEVANQVAGLVAIMVAGSQTHVQGV